MIMNARTKTMLTTVIIAISLLHPAASAAVNSLVFAISEGSRLQDISTQVLREAYQGIGYDIRILRLPNKRALLTSNLGVEVDGEVSRVEGVEARFESLIRVPVAINYIDGVAFSKRDDIAINGWDSLKPYSLVVVRGVIFVEQNLTDHKLDYHEVSLFTHAIKMLQAGRSDVAILPRVNGLDAIRSSMITDIKPRGKVLTRVALYHYLHRKNADLLPELTTL